MSVDPRDQLQQAIGGWRGAIESGAPSVAFLVVYQVSSRDLRASLWSAGTIALVAAVVRLLRRGSLQFVLSGVLGVAISAWLVARTGQAKDYFVPGLVTNILWGAAYLGSVLLRYPLIGVLAGALEGQPLKWVRDAERRRAATLATWGFVGLFALRLVVEVPLYMAGALNALGAAKLVLGWPPYLLAGWLAYRLMRPYFGSAPAEDLL